MKVIIKKDVLDKIKYLNNTFNNIEWGALIPFVINDDSNILILDVIPIEIGTGGEVHWNGEEENKEKPYIIEKYGNVKIGILHSHNNMGAFLSETDKNDIYERLNLDNEVLSIVTNNNLDFVAGLGIKIKVYNSFVKNIINIDVELNDDINIDDSYFINKVKYLQNKRQKIIINSNIYPNIAQKTIFEEYDYINEFIIDVVDSVVDYNVINNEEYIVKDIMYLETYLDDIADTFNINKKKLISTVLASKNKSELIKRLKELWKHRN